MYVVGLRFLRVLVDETQTLLRYCSSWMMMRASSRKFLIAVALMILAVSSSSSLTAHLSASISTADALFTYQQITVYKLETKASPRRQCSTGRILSRAYMLLYVSGVNYNVHSNYTKYLAQLCCRNFAFWEISAANLRILWRHLLMNYETFRAL